ncbi:putative alanine transaminase [Cantharellus anzutake]|uniref:putative alanine transaminase n=1 Tax=Cantharellus anzutake TaxID=1750568 RepID=UPI001907995A|nr:putative alanine transaminase [Cantharellus anzutake]KAF8318817.1 putative alanine transaminase [Cantharellus anzutake]
MHSPSALTLGSVNPALLGVQYAVRGELAIKAEVYRVRIKNHPNDHGLPFDKIVPSNIGNPQQPGLDQKPLTFGRQIASLLEYPELIETGKHLFPSDVLRRAKELYEEIGSIGAYSHSQGIPYIRRSVSQFIEKRDGYPSDPSHIFLTAGASAGVSLVLNILVASHQTGIMIPIPQYPLYSATLAQQSGVPVPYFLDESKGWSTDPQDVDQAAVNAKAEGINVRAIVIINPGNPTGALLDQRTMEAIVKVCEKHNLVLLADEVYQSNLHDSQNHPFTSFKKVVRDMKSPVALISFHSISKGVTGECGRRGGYFECTNVPEDVIALIYKMASVGLCPPVSGQIGVECLVRPPVDGDDSYPLWKKETDAIHAALAYRTKLMAQRLNDLPGVSCVESPGALYLFPRLHLPDKAIAEAKAAGKAPDTFYALALLDETGICAVSGDGFGQKEGEAHLRLTCLCAGVEQYIEKLEKFQRGFWRKYGGELASQ